MNASMDMNSEIHGKERKVCWRNMETIQEFGVKTGNMSGSQIELTPKEVEELMRHDSYRRVKGVIKQVGYSST